MTKPLVGNSICIDEPCGLHFFTYIHMCVKSNTKCFHSRAIQNVRISPVPVQATAISGSDGCLSRQNWLASACTQRMLRDRNVAKGQREGVGVGISISHLAALERASFQSIRRVSPALVSGKAAVPGSHEHALASAHHCNGAHLPRSNQIPSCHVGLG